MTVGELIEELQKYHQDLPVNLMREKFVPGPIPGLDDPDQGITILSCKELAYLQVINMNYTDRLVLR